MPEPSALDSEARFRLVLDVMQAITASFDLDEILNQLLETVRSVVPFDAAGIFILSKTLGPERARLSSHMIAGMALHGFPDRPREDDPMLRSGQGIVGHVIQTGTRVIAADVRLDPHYIDGRPETLSELAVPVIVSGRVIGAINLESDRPGAFTEADAEILEFIARTASMPIERTLLNAEILDKKRIESQLEVARQVQASLLPRYPPRIPGLDIAAINIPNIQVGGDYYDFIPLAGGRLGLVIADVSGKGVPAALIMASFCAALRTQLGHDPDLLEAVKAVNAFLVDTLEGKEFVTAFCASLDPVSHRLAYVNCGHNPPLLLRAGGRTEELDVGGTILGLSRSSAYPASEVTMQPGDLLLMYTDGVIEARAADGQEFGVTRLAGLPRPGGAAGAQATVDAIIRAAQVFSGSDRFPDDVTIVVVRRLDAGAGCG